MSLRHSIVLRTLVRGGSLAALLAAAALTAGCAGSGTASPHESDPWEGLNRGVFSFNEGVDRWVLEPTAKGWDAVMPDVVEESLDRFFENLRGPVHMANNLLQAKMEGFCMSTLRFVTNSSIGLAGFFDPATPLGLVERPEDFGQTLGAHGTPGGPYLVLPLFGPSNPRDLVGSAADGLVGPGWFLPVAANVAMGTVRIVNTRAKYLEQVRESRETSVDYYVFIRNAYLDYRRNQIADGEDRHEARDEELYELDETR